ncbi:hypothetical protein ACO0QE_000449 [Hanseniaspora vineae]
MHSATKYFGGHSDLLAGVLVVKNEQDAKNLKHDRVHLGTNISNLESFLLLRSTRTYEMRILKQSENVLKVVDYLYKNHSTKFHGVIDKITHSSLQQDDFVEKQLKGGCNPIFSIIF